MLKSVKPIIIKENYFSNAEIESLWKFCQQQEKVDFIDQYGVFKGKKLATQKFFDPDNLPEQVSNILNKSIAMFPDKVKIVKAVYQELDLPWDIHCDIVCDNSSRPYYNILIPFHNVDSRTIVFDQTADVYDEFWKYKQNNPKLKNPIDVDTWNQYLSYCWPEDREWLSIKQILPEQRIGQLIAFDRHYFHSSDSFHLNGIKTKYFLQAFLDLENS